jgi:Winged helix-turn-helix DNA-binding
VVDSIQTVRTRQTIKDSPSIRERVMGAARIARHLAVEHGLVMVYTSEVNRSWYRAKREEDRASDLAAFAEARIEFSGDVLLTLRSLDDDPDMVEVRIPKNRLGTRKGFLMRLDRERARFDAVDADYATAARSAAETERLDEARETILRELRDHPGVTRRQLQEMVSLKVAVFSDALKGLKKDGMVQTVPKGTAILHSLTEVSR